MRANLLTATVSAIMASTPGAWAAQVTLVSDRDNTLIEVEGGTVSNGAGKHMFAGRTAFFGSRRAVMRFDLSSIPAGATVTDVSLTLHMSLTIVGDSEQSLHRLLSNWGEGDSDAPKEEGIGTTAARGDATWLHTFFPDQKWGTSGGDYAAKPSASQTIGLFPGFFTWSGDGLVNDVQSWIDSADSSNFGWILIGDESQPTTAKRFDTRENPEPTFHPTLTVTYSPPCPADLNYTGTVNGLDLAILLGAWSGSTVYPGCPPHVPQDLNQDCKVNGLDLAILLGAWGPCP